MYVVHIILFISYDFIYKLRLVAQLLSLVCIIMYAVRLANQNSVHCR